jgi:hypothetical protein
MEARQGHVFNWKKSSLPLDAKEKYDVWGDSRIVQGNINCVDRECSDSCFTSSREEKKGFESLQGFHESENDRDSTVPDFTESEVDNMKVLQKESNLLHQWAMKPVSEDPWFPKFTEPEELETPVQSEASEHLKRFAEDTSNQGTRTDSSLSDSNIFSESADGSVWSGLSMIASAEASHIMSLRSLTFEEIVSGVGMFENFDAISDN